MKTNLFAAAIVVGSLSSAAQADFMPDNDLYKQDGLFEASNVSEAQFDAIIDRAEEIYTPIVHTFGGRFEVKRLWDNSTVNASAYQSGGHWVVNMYGGLARRPKITPDGFTLVLCHEIGHHLGGFPFVQSWSADEGQADYFATLECARQFWGAALTENARFRNGLSSAAKRACDDVWQTQGSQDLCYRTMQASKSISNLLAALQSKEVKFTTPDESVVSKTYDGHPDAQCRLDTYVAGAGCKPSSTSASSRAKTRTTLTVWPPKPIRRSIPAPMQATSPKG